MKIAALIARILLGLVFTVFGLNMFLHFMPATMPDGQAGAFVGALFTSGYIYVIGALQLIGGLLLLIGRWVPLGLVLLGPVIVNILCFHVFLQRNGLPIAIFVVVLSLIVLARYRSAFARLLEA